MLVVGIVIAALLCAAVALLAIGLGQLVRARRTIAARADELRSADAALREELSGLRTAVADDLAAHGRKLGERLDHTSQAALGRIGDLDERVGAVDTRLGELARDLDGTAQRVASLASDLADARSEIPAAVRADLADALQRSERSLGQRIDGLGTATADALRQHRDDTAKFHADLLEQLRGSLESSSTSTSKALERIADALRTINEGNARKKRTRGRIRGAGLALLLMLVILLIVWWTAGGPERQRRQVASASDAPPQPRDTDAPVPPLIAATPEPELAAAPIPAAWLDDGHAPSAGPAPASAASSDAAADAPIADARASAQLPPPDAPTRYRTRSRELGPTEPGEARGRLGAFAAAFGTPVAGSHAEREPAPPATPTIPPPLASEPAPRVEPDPAPPSDAGPRPTVRSIEAPGSFPGARIALEGRPAPVSEPPPRPAERSSEPDAPTASGAPDRGATPGDPATAAWLLGGFAADDGDDRPWTIDECRRNLDVLARLIRADVADEVERQLVRRAQARIGAGLDRSLDERLTRIRLELIAERAKMRFEPGGEAASARHVRRLSRELDTIDDLLRTFLDGLPPEQRGRWAGTLGDVRRSHARVSDLASAIVSETEMADARVR